MDALETLQTEFAKDDEVDYVRLAYQLRDSAWPALERLVRGDNPRMASQAVYLAALIDGSRSLEVVWQATHSRQAIVRVAAAFTLRRLPVTEAGSIAMLLLSDEDAQVRGRTIRFAVPSGIPSLIRRVRELAEHDPERWIRDLAARLLGTGGGPPGPRRATPATGRAA